MGQIDAIRGDDGALRTIRDVGEYDVWSTVAIDAVQAAELYAFSYAIGANVASGTGVTPTATKLETNLHVANQFVDESMNVYAIAIQPHRATVGALTLAAAQYTMTLADYVNLEAYVHFGFHVGGDKPFAEGKLTWFAEAGGIYGVSQVNNAAVLANNVPTPASARTWKYTLPIGRIEKFWARFEFPRGAVATGGDIAITVRLLGVRTRGVQ